MRSYDIQARVERVKRVARIPGATKLTFFDGIWLVFPPWEYTWKPGDVLRLRREPPQRYQMDVRINEGPWASFSDETLAAWYPVFLTFFDADGTLIG